jgi:D-beta-D-heptose 7-phosphate kinase/D-beta-D-heptose 1-phosphate adenosyltransferase
MTLIEKSGEVTHLQSEAREVFDVTGAGDTVLATLAAALAVGAPLREAAELANIAAGIVVGKVGTAVPYPADLTYAVRHQELSSAEAKVADTATAIDRVERWKHKGHTIGFTNGFFELLQPAHLELLSQASKACDRLVVGLNSDSSVYRNKGEAPVLHEAARSSILASLEVVDMVVIFKDDTPMQLIEELRPDVLIKGANYLPGEVVGADTVRSYGGKVLLADVGDMAVANSTIFQITKGNL